MLICTLMIVFMLIISAIMNFLITITMHDKETVLVNCQICGS